MNTNTEPIPVGKNMSGVNLPALRNEQTNVAPMNLEKLWHNPNAVLIPGGEGKEQVRILSKPAYFMVDHGITIISYSGDYIPVPLGKRAKASFYATYMFCPEGSTELRFLTMPVALFPGHEREAYNASLLAEITSQGFPTKLVTDNCQLPSVKEIFGYLDSRMLPSLRFLISGKSFLDKAGHPEDPRFPLVSGWYKLHWGPYHDLTIIGNPRRAPDPTGFREQGIYDFIDVSETQKYSPGVKPISKPFSPKSATELDIEMLKKVLAANGIKPN